VTDAEIEQTFAAILEQLAAIHSRHADEDAALEAADEAERRQALRDEITAHRRRHPLELVDVDQTARWQGEVSRAVTRFRQGRSTR
jgi:hypothetical protein